VAVSIEPGTRLGSYEVQEFIGQGAMGLVYRAYHPQLERFGAVKVLQGIASTPDGTARFRHEAQAIAQMRHPNIVNVYDFGEYEGTPYMIVEYVPGGNLASKMEQKPLDRTIALRYLRGIAAGLDYAHSLGIVHRDVKPGNVLLEKDETPVLADFGLVKLLQGSSIQSMTGVTTGTPAYMAPEQVMGHQVGPAADRYSLATMAYEMLTGVIPFDGDGVLELLYAHVHREPPAPSTRIAALTPAVDAVILRGLAKAPEARWDTATAFVEALALALSGQAPEPNAATVRMPPPAGLATKPLASKSRGAAATVAMAMPPLNPEPAPPAPKDPKRRRRLYEIVAGAVILILLLVVGGICAAADLQPTMSLDPTIAVPGDTVNVIASHLPADQFGQIQLHSDETFYFAFQAGGQGDFRQGIVIPPGVTTGMHVVKVCWSGSCPLQKQLRIVAPGTLPSPTPSSSASPLPSASGTPGTTATPGRSPRPESSPSSNPTSGSTSSPSPKASPKPSPKPTSTPRPSPTPTPNPCPTSTSSASLNASPNTVLLSGGTVTITGTHFTPNKSATLTYYKSGTPIATKTVPIACDGSFSTTVNVPGAIVPRTDKVTATDALGRTASTPISVV
jgi:eukaryotic-like serine/threonine-protein kinase